MLKGEPALVESTSPRMERRYYSAVCLETGEVEWMELEGNSNSGTSAAFLDQLRKGHAGPLNVIWDNAPAHRGEAVREYLRTIHQPNNPFFGSNVIGEESIDPSLYGIDDDLCVYNHVCRYSDAAYAELDGDEDLDLGGIAGPDGYNSTNVDPAYNTLSITKEEASFEIGDEIEFIGRTSGWEKAEITSTCTAIQVKSPFLGNPGNMILCAGKAEPLSGYNGPNEGDSGAPVFIRSGNNVELLGTLFFGGSQEFYFSKIGNIYWELGSSVSWDTCTSGC